MPESRHQMRDALQAMREKADLQVTSHSFLRDHYLGWSQRLSVYTLFCSAVLLFFTLASADFIQRTLGFSADGFKWAEGGAAFLTFCLSLIDLSWNPASTSKAHDQAVAHYLRMDYEIRNLLDSGALTHEKMRWLQEEYLDTSDLPRIPEGQSLRLKRHHLLKLAITQALVQNPHQLLWWLSLKLWWKAPNATTPPPAKIRSLAGAR